ncbi:MAG: cytochrome c3 family protein, partial [Candidatus Heimdallarchaeota archaeon]|nr:cytochrome c3 family protein [Candidatus Heimdallarchaeota archaeon]
MNVRLRKTLSFISIGLLLFIVAQIATAVYSSVEIIDYNELPEFEYAQDSFESQQIPLIYSEQDKNCVKCHYHHKDLKTCAGHENIACTDCHKSLKENTEYKRHEKDLPSALSSCIDCHKDYDKTHDVIHKNVKPLKNADELENIDSKDKFSHKPNCLDCHDPHETSLAKEFNGKVSNCIKCHDDEFSDYTFSKHYAALLEISKNAPNCLTCHDHNKPLPKNTLLLCVKCHIDPKRFSKDKIRIISGYFSEFHGRLALSNIHQEKDIDTLECKDCHGIHQTKGMNYEQKQECCGKSDCHDRVSDNFHKAIVPHGRINIKPQNDFCPWLINLLGKILLALCLLLALIDNIVQTLLFHSR